MTDNLQQLISEILAGDALSLSAAARKLVPHRGKSAAPSTLWRWHKEGITAPDGRRVHLELARVGAKWMTSAAALARFIAAQTPSIDTAPHTRSPTPQQGAKRAKHAGKELETAHGI
jgi:hypothetical protein